MCIYLCVYKLAMCHSRLSNRFDKGAHGYGIHLQVHLHGDIHACKSADTSAYLFCTHTSFMQGLNGTRPHCFYLLNMFLWTIIVLFLFLCVYTRICICIYTCTYIYIYIYVYISTQILDEYTHVRIYIYIGIHISIHVYIYTYVYIYMPHHLGQ